jgi:HEAT repeat protein
MTEKLPKSLIDELDGLMKQILHGGPEHRGEAMARLTEYEQAGRIPLSLLIQLADESNPAVAMYAASALGRSGQPAAVKKLLGMLAASRDGNPLILETVVDALGESKSPEATPALLDLLKLGASWTSRLREKFSRRSDADREREEKLRDQMTLPVSRALEKIADSRAAEAIGPFLDHADPLVRCHAIRTLLNAGFSRGLDRLRELAERDPNPLVKQLAQIAVDRLSPLPAHLNN